MTCKNCPYWYPNLGPDGTPIDQPSCKYPYDPAYAPCELEDRHMAEPSTVLMHHVTITQTRTVTISVPLDQAPSAQAAIALVAQEYVDNGTELEDSDWTIVNIAMHVDAIVHEE